MKSLSEMLSYLCPLNFKVVKLRSTLGNNVFSRNTYKHAELVLLYCQYYYTSALTFL